AETRYDPRILRLALLGCGQYRASSLLYGALGRRALSGQSRSRSAGQRLQHHQYGRHHRGEFACRPNHLGPRQRPQFPCPADRRTDVQGLGALQVLRADMMRMALFGLFLSLPVLAGSPADIVLEGEISYSDYHRYLEIPFTVPEGVSRLSVAFSHDGSG